MTELLRTYFYFGLFYVGLLILGLHAGGDFVGMVAFLISLFVLQVLSLGGYFLYTVGREGDKFNVAWFAKWAPYIAYTFALAAIFIIMDGIFLGVVDDLQNYLVHNFGTKSTIILGLVLSVLVLIPMWLFTIVYILTSPWWLFWTLVGAGKLLIAGNLRPPVDTALQEAKSGTGINLPDFKANVLQDAQPATTVGWVLFPWFMRWYSKTKKAQTEAAIRDIQTTTKLRREAEKLARADAAATYADDKTKR